MAEVIKPNLQTIFQEKLAVYIDALHRGDAEGMASIFMEDGIYLTSETILRGRKEIAAFYQSIMLDAGMREVKVSAPQITDKGDWAVIYMVLQSFTQDGELKITSPCLIHAVPVGDTMLIKSLAGF